MCLTQLLHDREPEPATARALAARSIEPKERLEHGIAAIDRNAGAAVQDVDLAGFDPSLPLGVLELKIQFKLSDGDRIDYSSRATLSTTPEPAMFIPVAGGLLALGGLAWRKRRLASTT